MNKAVVSTPDPSNAVESNRPGGMPRASARPIQISLGVLMLLMIVFAVMSAGLMYASRVDIVQDELNTLFGQEVIPSDGESSGRLPHLIFILFTLTSPLLLAGVLSTAVGIYRWTGRRA